MALAEVNRVRYVGFDFDTHVDDLRARLQVKFAAYYNDFALAALGMMLLDMIAYGLDSLSFYLDRRATEVYLTTARTRRGVARIARQLGYKMGGAVASSTDLTVSIVAAKSFTVPISQGFQFQGPNDLIFEAAEMVEWSPAEQAAGTSKFVPVYEGETVQETFTSNGTANQVFELARVPEDKFVASGSVEVTVDGASFKEEDFLKFEETDHYEVGYNDDPPTVRFGDGTAGNIPKTGGSIVVTYVATSGKSGIVSKDTIQSEVTPLVVVGEAVSLSINNNVGSSGGDDLESLDQAKAFAGRVFNSRRVAVTREDYEALAGSYADPVYGRVAVAQAISSRSAEADLVLQDAILSITSALEGAVDVLRDEIDDATTASTGTLYQILDYSSTITTALDNIVTSINTISTNVAAILSGVRTNRNLTLTIDTDADTAKTHVTDGKTLVNGFSTGGSTTLLVADRDAILAYFNSIDTLQDAIIASAATIKSASDTQIGALGLVNDEIDKIGLSLTATQLDGSDSYLKSAEDARASIDVIVGFYDTTTPSDSTGLFKTFQFTLETEVADVLDPTISNNSAAIVSENLTIIDEHVDKILSADCKANLVTVPILVRDAAGFYTEPSNGLVGSLEDYLTTKKEVTQTVEVVSGGKFLIYPVISARVGVSQGYSLEQTRTAVETSIDGVLKDRDFGASLYLSDLIDVILEVEGIGFVNVSIDGYTTLLDSSTQTANLDSDGNLIIDISEVITKTPGSITVTPEVIETVA
jgi:hypothetical protein